MRGVLVVAHRAQVYSWRFEGSVSLRCHSVAGRLRQVKVRSRTGAWQWLFERWFKVEAVIPNSSQGDAESIASFTWESAEDHAGTSPQDSWVPWWGGAAALAALEWSRAERSLMGTRSHVLH